MRSPQEIGFRLRQELINAKDWFSPPRVPAPAKGHLPGLPEPARVIEQLRGSEFETDILLIADQIMRHRFPMLGITVDAGEEIHWRRDYVYDKESVAQFIRFVPYLNFDAVGDHKMIWELNRHQHLVLLAQAWRFTHRREYLQEIENQLHTWFQQNPMNAGINWSSALEVAFRVLSWAWVWHLASDALSEDSASELANGIFQHARHLRANLSIYFSPNTHLLGEAVALHAIGRLFPSFPGASEWVQCTDRIVSGHIAEKVRSDGTYFEQSSYYHVYALDMAVFHSLMGGSISKDQLGHMAAFLAALMGQSRKLPILGDDDGGRFFHPYGSRNQFGRSTLATCSCLLDGPWPAEPKDLAEQAAWWLPKAAPRPGKVHFDSEYFPDTGIAVMVAGRNQVIVDAGQFGAGSAGHSHSDTLSINIRRGDEEILIDPGTYTYVAEPQWRSWFRGSAAHSTIRINHQDQAMQQGPFRWSDVPTVKTLGWAPSTLLDLFDAVCTYGGFTHRRRVRFLKPNLVFILDEVSGPGGSNLVEQFWHLGAEGMEKRLATAGYGFSEYIQGGDHGWKSNAFGAKEQAVAIRVSWQGVLPVTLGAIVDLSEEPEQTPLYMQKSDREIVLSYGTASTKFLVDDAV